MDKSESAIIEVDYSDDLDGKYEITRVQFLIDSLPAPVQEYNGSIARGVVSGMIKGKEYTGQCVAYCRTKSKGIDYKETTFWSKFKFNQDGIIEFI